MQYKTSTSYLFKTKKKEAQLDIALVQQVPCLVILRKWQFINFKEKETVFILRP